MTNEIDYKWLLQNHLEWFCQDCHTFFWHKFPPVCPNCGSEQINDDWVKEQKAKDLAYYEQVKAARAEENRKIAERKERIDAEFARFREYLIDLLNRHGIPQPIDEKAYRVSYWKGREPLLLMYFKRFARWEPLVGKVVAHKQVKYELTEAARRARHAGLSRRKVEELFGGAIEGHADRLAHRARPSYIRPSPVEDWMEEKDWLAEFLNKTRRPKKLVTGRVQWGMEDDHYCGA